MEKWADKVSVVSWIPEREEAVRALFTGALPDLYGAVGLPRTAREDAVIAEAVAALNDFRRVFCGLPALEFSADRIHVLSREEFDRKIGQRSDGKTMLGHVYVPRQGTLGDFAAAVSHELVHAASYLWLVVKEVVPPGADRPKRWITYARAGLLLADPAYGLALPHFHGYNEAVTEAAAVTIRTTMASRSATLDAEEKRDMLGVQNYCHVMALLDRLVARAAAPSGDVVGVWRRAFVDCMTGSDGFLAHLDARVPGASDVLRRTGARPEEVLLAAEALGIDDVAAAIRNGPA